MSFGIIAATVVSAGVGLYEGAENRKQQGQIANSALGLAQQTQGEQMQVFQQLQDLISNPDSFFKSSVFTSARDQGTQAVERSAAAGGFLKSGNEATALQAYGQTFAGQQLLGQESLLASMSGTTNASSPSQALGTASSANQASFNQLGTLLAALGQSGSMFKGFGGGGGGGGGDGGVVPGDPNQAS
jgi:hypothetical protein